MTGPRSRAVSLRGLYGIADAAYRPELPFPAKLVAFLDGGAAAIQVRVKGPSGAILARTREAVSAGRGRALVIVNDRVDVALLCGADGVHVGADDLPIAEVRRIAGDRLVVGATVRDLAGARAAASAGADYVGFGPMFPTATKAVGVAPRTVEQLREVVAGAGVPVVAICGITLERAAALFAAGAAAVAVVSDVLGHADPTARARAYAHLSPRPPYL